MMDQNIGLVVLPLGRSSPGKGIDPLGTCFAITANKLATAGHVTGPSDEGLAIILRPSPLLNEYQDTTNNRVNSVDVRIVQYDPVHDVSILEFKDPATALGFPYVLGSSDDIAPGSPIISLGYPHADHGRVVLTQQSSMVGARVILGSEFAKTKAIVLNTQTRPGQSGGPVFTPDGKRVCAMITGGYAPGVPGISLGGIDPQTLHQTTHAISAEYIKALL